MKKAASLVPLLLSLSLASCVEKPDILLGTWTIPESGIGTMKDEFEGTLKVTLSDEERTGTSSAGTAPTIFSSFLSSTRGRPLFPVPWTASFPGRCRDS